MTRHPKWRFRGAAMLHGCFVPLCYRVLATPSWTWFNNTISISIFGKGKCIHERELYAVSDRPLNCQVNVRFPGAPIPNTQVNNAPSYVYSIPPKTSIHY